MYAPKQYRPERRKPENNYLALEETNHQGVTMAPPQYESAANDRKNQGKGSAPESTANSPKTESKKAGKSHQQEKKAPGNKMVDAPKANQPKPPLNQGASETPPQFKLEAGRPLQFKVSASSGRVNDAQKTTNPKNGLPQEVKAQMEGAFGTSFDDVKITENSSAAKENGALAFAQGNNIHFAPGQYNPHSKGGQELLGHELAHVVQQRQGRVQANAHINGMAVNNDHRLESEADQLGAKAANFKTSGQNPVKEASPGAPQSGAAQMKLNTSPTHQPSNQGDAKHEALSNQEESKAMNRVLALDGFTKTSEEAGKNSSKPSKDKKESKAQNAQKASEKLAKGEPNSGSGEAENKENKENKAPTTKKERSKEDKKGGGEGQSKSKKSSNKQLPKKSKPKKTKGAGGTTPKSGTNHHEGKAASDNKNDGAKTSASHETGAQEHGHKKNTPVLKRTPVVAPQHGNFGEGEEPELMIVNEEALKEIGQDRVIKKNDDGTYVVVSGSLPKNEAAAPMQMAPDPSKKKPVKTKVPKSSTKELFAANREKAKGSLKGFDSEATSKIAALETQKSLIKGQLASHSKAAKSIITASKAAEKSKVRSAIESQKQALRGDAKRLKAETYAHLQSALALVKATAHAAREKVEATFLAEDSLLLALEPLQKEKFSQSLENGQKALHKAAEEQGKVATARCQNWATKYAQEKHKEDGDLESDRREARVNAAIEVGQQFVKTFNDEAEKQSQNLKNGEGELHQFVSNTVKTTRESLRQRKQGALQAIQRQETGASQRLRERCLSSIQQIDKGLQSGISMLAQHQSRAISMIETTAQGKLQAVDQTAQEHLSNLEAQLKSSQTELTNQKNHAITQISKQKNPNNEKIARHLKHVLKGIADGVASTQESIGQAVTGSRELLHSTATETTKELTSAATTAATVGKQLKVEALKSLDNHCQGYKKIAQSLAIGTTKSINKEATSAAQEIQDQSKTAFENFAKAYQNLEGKMAQNALEFKGNLSGQLADLDNQVQTKAKEAADDVQPRWVRWALVIIEVIVVAIITAVLLFALFSGVGILALILIGIALGAAGGALKYGARIALTNEEFSGKTLGKEILDGAFDGAQIAVSLIPGLGTAASIVLGVGMSALGGAFKYMTDVAFTEKEFDAKTLLKKTALGTLEGLISVGLGILGDKVGGMLISKIGKGTIKFLGESIRKKLTSLVVQSMGSFVMGGFSAVIDNYIETGTLNWNKFKEKMTPEGLFKEFALNLIGEAGSHTSNQIHNQRTSHASTPPSKSNNKKNTTPTKREKSPSKSAGAQQAQALGYPPAKDGYQWIANPKGAPYIKRQKGSTSTLPELKFDSATGKFETVSPAPLKDKKTQTTPAKEKTPNKSNSKKGGKGQGKQGASTKNQLPNTKKKNAKDAKTPTKNTKKQSRNPNKLEILDGPELEKHLSQKELPGSKSIKNDKLLRAKSVEEFVGQIAQWLNANHQTPNPAKFILLHNIEAVKAYEKRIESIILKKSPGMTAEQAKEAAALIGLNGEMPAAAAFGGKIALLPHTIDRINSKDITERIVAMKTICHEWWHAMRKGTRHHAFEEGGADVFSEMMVNRMTKTTQKLPNAYQHLKDGVQLLKNAMGEKWFLESRSAPNTAKFLQTTLTNAGYDPKLVAQVAQNSTNVNKTTQQGDWLISVQNLLKPK